MRLLIVEDDPPLRDALRQGLEEAGFANIVRKDTEAGTALLIGRKVGHTS